MNLVDVFLWVILPFTVVAIFIMSIIWQYDGPLQEDQNLEKFTYPIEERNG